MSMNEYFDVCEIEKNILFVILLCPYFCIDHCWISPAIFTSSLIKFVNTATPKNKQFITKEKNETKL